MVAAIPEPVQRLLLYSVPWKMYDALLHAFEGRHLRITYDRGTLEIMTLSYPHEFYKTIFGRFIEILTLEWNIPLQTGGSMTFRGEGMEKGLEPDECYWIQNAARMQGKMEFDIDVDPTPDLAVEIDITSSSINRMGIYAKLGIGEVWRFDGDGLQVNHLVRGKYKLRDHSRAFPFLAATDLLQFVKEVEATNQTAVMRKFTEWVRKCLVKPSAEESSRHGNGRSKSK